MVASDEVIDVHGPTYQDYIAEMSFLSRFGL
jgi:hypothetical protein